MAASGSALNDVEAKVKAFMPGLHSLVQGQAVLTTFLSPRQMLELAEFPLQLCNVMDSQILRAAARKLASLFPELSYIR